MPSQIQITSFTGGLPAQVFVSDVYGNNNTFVGSIVSAIPPTIYFTLPSLFDFAPAVKITIIDANGCEEFTIDECLTIFPSPTPTETPTQTPTNTPSCGYITSFDVTNSGASAYIINGDSNPTLNLAEGQTYTFDIAATGHPFWIKTSPVTGTVDAYNDGVTNNGIANGTITFTVPYDAPSTLYYICQIHGSMQGVINICDVPEPTVTQTETPTQTPTVSETPTETPTNTPTSDPTQTPTSTPTRTVTPTPTCTGPGTFLAGNLCYGSEWNVILRPSSLSACQAAQGLDGPSANATNQWKSCCDYQSRFVEGNPSGCLVYDENGDLAGNGWISDGCLSWQVTNGVVTSSAGQICTGADPCCGTTPT
jgi:hypothetical protein